MQLLRIECSLLLHTPPHRWAVMNQPLPPNGISICSAVFAQYVSVTDTQTDTSVATCRVCAMPAMRPNVYTSRFIDNC